MKKVFLISCFLLSCFVFLPAQATFEIDTIQTSSGPLKMAFIGHGTLLFNLNDINIHIDPVGSYADYSKMPSADIILVTHHHGDHLDTKAIKHIKKETTKIYCSQSCSEKLPEGKALRNGDIATALGIKIEAVPAYNLLHKRDSGEPFHPKGVGNGYVLTIGKTRVYVAGDTENIPEMAQLKEIDFAFLPMNLPYTMTPEMVANAVSLFNPKVLYPYHFGNTDLTILEKLMKDNKECELRLRKLQ